MLALLRTRRWQGFTALVVVVIVAFGLLSRWQWSRAEEKRLEQQAQSASTAEPITPALDAPPDEFTAVQVTGTYLPDTVRLVRQRPLEGRNGFWVMEQLETDRGSLWVLRGWVPSGARAGDSPIPDSAATGQVVVTGFARPLADGAPLPAGDRQGLPIDQVTEISTGQLPSADATQWYVQLRESSPGDPLTVVPLSEPDDLQNISYAIQWLLFAAVAIGGWFFFLRREAKEEGIG